MKKTKKMVGVGFKPESVALYTENLTTRRLVLMHMPKFKNF